MFWSIVRILVGIYAGLAIFVLIFQSRLVYYPERVMSMSPRDIGLSFEHVSFRTSDGLELCGWFVPSGESADTILFCHGNAGNISHRLDSIGVFRRMGLNVFIFDYRGYGNSEGHPSEKGTYLDAEAAWDYLTETRQIPPEGIIIFGRSLGGAVAAWLARERSPRALIVESAFTSVSDVGAEYYPYLPVRLLSRFSYNTRGYITHAKCPVLVVHSRTDELIAFDHGQRLFEAAGEPKEFLEITGSHDYGFLDSARKYKEGMKAFLSKIDGKEKT